MIVNKLSDKNGDYLCKTTPVRAPKAFILSLWVMRYCSFPWIGITDIQLFILLSIVFHTQSHIFVSRTDGWLIFLVLAHVSHLVPLCQEHSLILSENHLMHPTSTRFDFSAKFSGDGEELGVCTCCSVKIRQMQHAENVFAVLLQQLRV